MIRRIPFILFILTMASLVFMIIVRLSVMDLRPLSMSSGTGRFFAGSYNFSVILFLILLAGLIAVTIAMYLWKKKKNAAKAAQHFSEEDAFENPAQWNRETES